MKIWVDGSGWNGKESRWCVAFEDGTIKKGSIPEEKTNNEMEYEALINALKLCSDKDCIFTDSQLVEGQIMKGWKITKEHLFPLVMKAKQLIKEKNVPLAWISRNENFAGHILDNKV